MEAVVKQVRTTKRPWLIACDANMCREDFKKSLWFTSRHMFIEASGEGVSTCRSKVPNGEFIDKTYDSVIVSHKPSGKSQEYGGGGRLRIKTTQGGHFLGRRTQRVPGMASAKNAKSFVRIQCWKAARTRQSGRMKRRIERGGRSNDGERVDECNPAGESQGDRRSRGWGHSQSCVCNTKHSGAGGGGVERGGCRFFQ